MRKLLTAIFSLATAIGCTHLVQRPSPEFLFSYSDFPELEHLRNVQGCAIDKGYLFSLEDRGWCNVFDLRINEPVAHFPLGSYGKENHANIAFFGPFRYDSSDKFPLLYVSQCKSKIVSEIGLPDEEMDGQRKHGGKDEADQDQAQHFPSGRDDQIQIRSAAV